MSYKDHGNSPRKRSTSTYGQKSFGHFIFSKSKASKMFEGDHNKQILAYSAGSMAFSLMSSAFSFYYVKVFLNIYGIEEKWFQTAQMLYLVWNAINDPLFAYCQDNKNSQFTKTRRNVVLYGAPFFALSFVIPWFPWGHNSYIVGVQLILSLCFWDTMYTLVGLAMCCLFSEISQLDSDRLKLTRFSNIGCLLGSSTIMILQHTSNNLENFQSFQITSIGIAICSWLLFRYCGKNCHTAYDLEQMKEGNKTADEVCHMKEHTESYWRQTWQILSDRNFLSFVITNFCQEFHRNFLSNFMAIFCDQLISKDLVSTSFRNTFYGGMSMTSQLLVIIGAPLVVRFSYFRTIRASFIWKLVAGIGMFCIGRDYPLVLMCFVFLDSCFANAAFSLFNMPLSDIADANMIKYNRKHPISSMIFGTNALVVKPAISLSPMLVVTILNRYGYSQLQKDASKLTTTELDSLKSIMFNIFCLYPIILGMIQFMSWSFFTIKKKVIDASEMQCTQFEKS